MVNPVSGPVLKAARRLKYPKLLVLTAVLFVVDFVVPDPIPFLDEILLGLATLVFARWREPPAPESVDQD